MTIFGCLSSSNLRGVGRVLFGATESHFAGTCPTDDVTAQIGEGNDDVVEEEVMWTWPMASTLLFLTRFVFAALAIAFLQNYS